MVCTVGAPLLSCEGMSTITHQPLILATGFSVFPGAPENPTAWVMQELKTSGWLPPRARLATRILPVYYDMWENELGPLLAQAKPDAIVAFGLSAKATGFTLESTAHNRFGLGRPDASGTPPPGDKINDDGPADYRSQLPLREIASTLMRADLPVDRSDDAGDYVCNMLFYRLMAHVEATGAPRIAGFVHVPYLDDQVARLADAGLATSHLKTMTRNQLLQGARAILGVVADALVDAAPKTGAM